MLTLKIKDMKPKRILILSAILAIFYICGSMSLEFYAKGEAELKAMELLQISAEKEQIKVDDSFRLKIIQDSSTLDVSIPNFLKEEPSLSYVSFIPPFGYLMAFFWPIAGLIMSHSLLGLWRNKNRWHFVI